ncbi:MAG TPA: bifunctional hydroxymethylpyrimidine kinase/phosphomethylpyrimidine kinase [Actinomycetota bacterium]|nr:bifunctional hydroxymethylpyrimidine kinase/phosphomethylpyrimidine kinase [Actinomycetota bacterium]
MAALPQPVMRLPRALTIAGSDSGGGAGIQTDLKVFFALGCHGTSAITAVTAQNTTAVLEVMEMPPALVKAQIDAVVDDIGFDAAKTGMLGSPGIVESVVVAIQEHDISPLVVDPVALSKHGDELIAPAAVAVMTTELLPLATIVTPNVPEAEMLSGIEISDENDMREAAIRILAMGPGAVLVKGGHLEGGTASDLLLDGNGFESFEGPRWATKDTHGTGCALSAAITSRLAHGDTLHEAVGYAKGFISGAIERSLRLGAGHGPVNPGWQWVNARRGA